MDQRPWLPDAPIESPNRSLFSPPLSETDMAAEMGSGNAGIQEPSPELQKVDQNGTPRQGEGILPTDDLPLLKVKRLSDKAVLPSRASPLSAGYDLSR
ncbi:hypothetical protein B296_00012158 [Ensete ventricosum]|uniref:Uncharacterized protein n=1 Tax=Ensete ventricosum TaxID=4639 RepID=A0A427A633_ENSVE|nr:hypothetical protein B296_00012158 [Ensete ventricosum]